MRRVITWLVRPFTSHGLLLVVAGAVDRVEACPAHRAHVVAARTKAILGH
jgi:hypothetical protein